MNPAIAFVAIAALLTALVMWVLLRPLLKRRVDRTADSAEVNTNVQALRIELSEARRDHALGLLSDAALPEAERELEARVLTEANGEAIVQTPRYKRTAVALGLLLPIFAVVGYASVGSPAGVLVDSAHPAQASAPANNGGGAGSGAANPSGANNADAQMDELFRMAEERLAKEPNDAKGWLLLARAKSSVGRFADAMKAYEKAAALLPTDADVWADYADAAAGMSQGDMKGKPLELINKSLALDSKNLKALLLRGTYEIQVNELAAAEKTFTLAKSLSEANSGFAQIADNALQDIRSRTGAGATSAPSASGAPTAASAAAPAAATANGAPLAAVTLSLSADARKAAEANTAAAVFLIVRAAGADRGPPLAAKKLSAADLDKPVTLTAADGMIGGAGLKAGVDVTVQARLSLAGQPMAQTGDWQSPRINAKLPATDLKLSITESVKP